MNKTNISNRLFVAESLNAKKTGHWTVHMNNGPETKIGHVELYESEGFYMFQANEEGGRIMLNSDDLIALAEFCREQENALD
jgi:hypothetical protein